MKDFSFNITDKLRYNISYQAGGQYVSFKKDDAITISREYLFADIVNGWVVREYWKEESKFVFPVDHFSVIINLIEKFQSLMVLK